MSSHLSTIPTFVPSHSILPRLPNAPPRRPRVRPTYFLPNPRPLRARLMRHPSHVRWTSAATAPDSKPASRDVTPRSSPRWRTRALWAMGGLATIGLLAAFARGGGIGGALMRAELFIGSVGIRRGCLALFMLNFCTVLFCFPANIGLMLASGAVLGAGPAFVTLHASKTTAACVAFLLARGILAPRVAQALAKRPRVAAALDASGANAGWKFVLLMRLSPFPGFLLNYALSITKVTFWEYAVATAIGVVPSVANLCLIGAAARDVGAVAAGVATPVSWLATAVRVFCMGSMLFVSVLATRSARAAFAALNADDSPHPDEEMGLVGTNEDDSVGMTAKMCASHR